MKNIRILLNENRKKQHLSYRKLSKLTGVASSTLSDYETGKRIPKPKYLRLISINIGVHYLELLESLNLGLNTNIDNEFIKKYYDELPKDKLYESLLNLSFFKEEYQRIIDSLENNFKTTDLTEDDKYKLFYTIDDYEYLLEKLNETILYIEKII